MILSDWILTLSPKPSIIVRKNVRIMLPAIVCSKYEESMAQNVPPIIVGISHGNLIRKELQGVRY